MGGASEVNLSAPAIETPTVTTEIPPQPELISEPKQEPPPEAGTGQSVSPVANDGEGSQRRAFVGVVDGEPDATVDVIRNGTNERVTIRLDDYKLKQPGKKAAGSFADGAKVVILSQRDGDDWLAIWVMVKPQKLVNRPVVGTVVGVENGVLSIVEPDGTTSTIELPEGAEVPEAGEVVTLFADETEADDSDNKKKRRKGKGLVKASKVRERLEGFLQELTTDEAGVSENAPSGKVTSARNKAEAAQEKALEARSKSDAARAKADVAQAGEASDLNESATEAEEAAVDAEVELAEAEAEAAEAEAESVEEAAEAETKAAKRRAKRVDDVASILDSLTSQHTEILRSLAEGNRLPAEALHGITKALENAQRGRSQANLKSAQARAKSEEKKQARLAKVEEKRKKAQAKAAEKREKAQAKAAEIAAKDQAKAAKKAAKDQGGKPKSAGKPDNPAGSSGEGGKPESAGKPDNPAGNSGKAGKPESAGQPDNPSSNSGQGNSQGKKK